MAHIQGEILPIYGSNNYEMFFYTDPELGDIYIDGEGKPFFKDYPLP